MVLVGPRRGILWAACSLGQVLLLTRLVAIAFKRILGPANRHMIGA